MKNSTNHPQLLILNIIITKIFIKLNSFMSDFIPFYNVRAKKLMKISLQRCCKNALNRRYTVWIFLTQHFEFSGYITDILLRCHLIKIYMYLSNGCVPKNRRFKFIYCQKQIFKDMLKIIK